MTLSDVDALVFDVFGTVVDWRSGVVRAGERLGEAEGLDVDWTAFADAWREEYQPSLARVRRGEIPWRNLDPLHRESLERLLDRFGVEGLTDEEAYLTAVDLLDLQPEAVAMVAAHERDLDAAREAGLRTAYVHRPLEWGPDPDPERADRVEKPNESAYDVVAEDVLDLAERLGADPLV